jgi:DNA-binding transcriptional LysR family regulator
MHIEWLEDIILVAETGSFSAAAERRGLTKSAFSRRLRHIEQQLGVELFDRRSKPARLHPSIVSQKDSIFRAIGQVNEVVRDLQHSDRLTHEVLRIGTTHSFSLTKVPDLTAQARDAVPSIVTRVIPRERDDAIGMLLSRSVDIAIVPRLEGWQDALAPDVVETIDIGTEVLSPFGTAEMEDAIASAPLDHIKAVLSPTNSFLRGVLEHRVLPETRRMAQLVPIDVSGSTIGLMGYVAKGFGVGWLPESLVHWCADNQGLKNLSGSLPSDRLMVSIVRLRDRINPVHQQIWEAMTAERV